MPSAVAASALSTPIVSECRSAAVRSGSSNNRLYQSVVKPIQVVLTRGDVPNPPRVWLKLNRMMTKIGNDRYRMNAPTYVGRIARVHRRLRRRAGGSGSGASAWRGSVATTLIPR